MRLRDPDVPRRRPRGVFDRPIGATVARQIPVLKVTRSNRVSVTGLVGCTPPTVHPQVVRDLLPRVSPARRRLRTPQVALAVPPRGRRATPSRGNCQCITQIVAASHRSIRSARHPTYWLIYAQAMDGKEEIRVVEEEPSWTGGSLESLDVIDKVPDESVKLATD